MSIKTVSEKRFEEFCAANEILCTKIEENQTASVRTPDYLVTINGQQLVFEIKQLDKDIRRHDGSWSLTPGDIIRNVIKKKNSQIKNWAEKKFPTILLIYNNFDHHFQLLGTDQHDFIAAMYGEMTILLDRTTMKIVDSFHGKNSKCQPKSNTSFSAIGGIYQRGTSVEVRIYENVYAKVPIDYVSLPSCIVANRVQLTSA